jgi:hypothetical protein
VRVFTVKWFARFVRRERIGADQLCEAVERVSRGIVDAELGGGVIKLRISRKNQGRSGGYRAILFFRAGVLAVFVYGFSKNDRANINPQELIAFKRLASEVLTFGEDAIETALESGAWSEVDCNVKAVSKRGPEGGPRVGSGSSSRRARAAAHDARFRRTLPDHSPSNVRTADPGITASRAG